MNLKSVTRNYLAFQVFFALLFWLPVFYEVQKRLGLSDAQIFSIQSFYYLLFCVLELPTGALADRFGMILSLRLGAVALVIAHLAVVVPSLRPGLVSPEWIFYAHFSFIALARSLISGASNAYLYEAFTREGRGAEYVEVEGKARAYGLFAKIVCWSVVGYLTQQVLLASYWLSLMSSLVSVYFAWKLPEAVRPVSGERQTFVPLHSRLKAVLFSGVGIVGRKPRLLGLMIQGMGVFVLARVVQVNLFQPLLLSRGFSTSSLGWVMALMTALEAWGSLRVKKILRHFSAEKIVSAFTALVALAVMSFALFHGVTLLLSLGIFSLLIGFVGPIQRQVINAGIEDSSHRATVLSLESLLDRLVCSVVAWFLGVAMSHSMMSSFILGCGAFFLVIAITQLRAGSRVLMAPK